MLESLCSQTREGMDTVFLSNPSDKDMFTLAWEEASSVASDLVTTHHSKLLP